MAIYRANDLARYATTQVAEGTALLTHHVLDRLGLCRRCGHNYPCDSAKRGTWLVNHYEPYADRPALVRPYVTAALRSVNRRMIPIGHRSAVAANHAAPGVRAACLPVAI